MVEGEKVKRLFESQPKGGQSVGGQVSKQAHELA